MTQLQLSACAKAWRASVLYFDGTQARWLDDGLLVTDGQGQHSRIMAVGDYRQLASDYSHLPCTHFEGLIIAPGFVDLHIHYPQTDVIGSPAKGLLPWLENYTFVHEARFNDADHASEVADFFLAELLRHGVTTALTFATSHPESVSAIFTAAKAKQMRLITGKVLQDRHSPNGVRDDTEQGLIHSEALIQQWHGQDRLGYAITPRFAPTSSEAQLAGAGELAQRYPSTWIQTHVAENVDEVAWVQSLFPKARSYLSVYEDFGLMRQRAVYAHCIHLDEHDRRRMKALQAAVAVCPSSNLFLGSGSFDFEQALHHQIEIGLASDVGGGTSFNPFYTMMCGYYAGIDGQRKTGMNLTAAQLWWMHTAGAAQALGLGQCIGNLQAGFEADFVVIDPKATPLLARRTAQASNLEELLFALMVMGDDRAIAHTIIAGEQLHSSLSACVAPPI
jgi:guanine deaminase